MSNTTSQLGTQALDPDLEPGQVVGEYQVEGKLGQGGFGSVFKAVHPLIGKVVAIKVLARKYSVDQEMVSRFIAEAKAVNQIRHRHIIDIFSFGQLPGDGRHYYVMEYLDGETLDKVIDSRGKLPLAEALPVLRAIARALDAAHAKGIAHRDLKPENVFLAKDPDGGAGAYWPKLLDFGIAKLLANDDGQKHKTRTGMPIGTPYYMSPEQCRGKDVDHRTDYYAFGVVAYQVLTGQYPIDGDDFMTMMMRQINDEPAPPSIVNPELPQGVDDVIAWLMKKDPAARPPNLVTAIRALDSVAEQSGISVPRSPISQPIDVPVLPRPPTSPAQPAFAVATTMPSGLPVGATLPPQRKSRALVYALAAVGAFALGAAVFFGLSRNGEQPAPAPVPAGVPAAGSATATAAGSATATAAGSATAAAAGSATGTATAAGSASAAGSAAAPVHSKPPHKSTRPRPAPTSQGSDHDSHDIENPFH